MTLTSKQSKIVQAALHGHSVLVCGLPCSGKTHVGVALRKIHTSVNFVTCCPRAAERCGLELFQDWVAGERSDCCILVVDDAHLLDASQLTFLDGHCRRIRGSDRPFGGIAVVVLLNILQCQAVMGASIMESFPFVVHLTSPFIDDKDMQQALVDICYHKKPHEVAIALAQHKLQESAISLILSTKEADMVNISELNNLSSPSRSYVAFVRSFDVDDETTNSVVEAIHTCLPVRAVLTLRIGARVMLSADYDKAHGYYKGMKGTVTGFDADGCPKVQFDHHGCTVVENIMWCVPREPRVQVMQLPLILGWVLCLDDLPSFSVEDVVINTSKIQTDKLYHILTRCKSFKATKLI